MFLHVPLLLGILKYFISGSLFHWVNTGINTCSNSLHLLVPVLIKGLQKVLEIFSSNLLLWLCDVSGKEELQMLHIICSL